MSLAPQPAPPRGSLTRQQRLDAILDPAGIPSLADKLWLAEQIETPSQATRRRLAVRDGQVRWALELLRRTELHTARPTVLAERLSRELKRYLASPAWRADRAFDDLPAHGRDGISGLRRTLHRIATLNEGESIGWRQIYNVMRGERTPIPAAELFAINSEGNCKKQRA